MVKEHIIDFVKSWFKIRMENDEDKYMKMFAPGSYNSVISSEFRLLSSIGNHNVQLLKIDFASPIIDDDNKIIVHCQEIRAVSLGGIHREETSYYKIQLILLNKVLFVESYILLDCDEELLDSLVKHKFDCGNIYLNESTKVDVSKIGDLVLESITDLRRILGSEIIKEILRRSISVVVFDSSIDLVRFMDTKWEASSSLPIGKGGRNGIFVVMDKDHKAFKKLLMHELAHLMCHRLEEETGPINPWIHEALGKYVQEHDSIDHFREQVYMILGKNVTPVSVRLLDKFEAVDQEALVFNLCLGVAVIDYILSKFGHNKFLEFLYCCGTDLLMDTIIPKVFSSQVSTFNDALNKTIYTNRERIRKR